MHSDKYVKSTSSATEEFEAATKRMREETASMQRWQRIDRQLDRIDNRIDRFDRFVEYFERANKRMEQLFSRLDAKGQLPRERTTRDSDDTSFGRIRDAAEPRADRSTPKARVATRKRRKLRA